MCNFVFGTMSSLHWLVIIYTINLSGDLCTFWARLGNFCCIRMDQVTKFTVDNTC